MTAPIEPMEAVKVLLDALEAMRSAFSSAAWACNAPSSYVEAWNKSNNAINATAHVEAPTSEPVYFVQHAGKPSCMDWTEVPEKAYKNFADAGFNTRTLYAAKPVTPSQHHIACDRKRPTLCNACIAEDAAPQALPATEQAKVRREAGHVMMSAHALCPTEQAHPERMRWMAAYFLANYPVSPAKPDLSGLILYTVDHNGIWDAKGNQAPFHITDEGTPSLVLFADLQAILAQPVAQAKPDASERDAARYRYMRSNSQFSKDICALRWYLPRFGRGTFAEQLDSAIDADIAATTSKPNAEGSGA